jgi:ornithine decarboxylase
MQKFKTVDELVSQLQPVKPVYCIRKQSVTKAANFFIRNFPGDVLYAVKTNPNKKILKYLNASGINNFDIASINEIKTIKSISSNANGAPASPFTQQAPLQLFKSQTK